MSVNSGTPSFDVVVPTVGRPSLRALLAALERATGPRPGRVVLVEDRRAALSSKRFEPLTSDPDVVVLPGRQAGPAAARNIGWRSCDAEWVAFLDDDVVPDADWYERLAEDLAGADPEVAGVQGRLRVPLPTDHRPTDWERNVSGLETARWATADMAYRRSVLEEVGGFDERFGRAFREDADLALRVMDTGYRLVPGRRTAAHPVPPAGRWVSVRLQKGNADDALMRALHGPGWHDRAEAPRGRLARHVGITAAAAAGLAGLAVRRPLLAAMGGLAWLAGTAELAWARIAPGPRTPKEVATMVATSIAIPPVAAFHRLHGELRCRTHAGSDSGSHPQPSGRETAGKTPAFPRPERKGGRLERKGGRLERKGGRLERKGGRLEAVLLDRDGTLVEDVAYNADPGRVVPMPGAREALDRLRAAGVPTAVVSNQSGVARGLITPGQLESVNRRVEELLGPLGPWLVCPHGPDDGCDCRKPAPGLVLRAAEELGVDPRRCALIGDIGPDVEAARAAGARAVLVPTPATRTEEVEDAPEVAPDLVAAIDLLLDGAT